jgi:hypothetical protein
VPKKPGCKAKMIIIKSKRGKTVASFMGHTGAACPKRRKPSTKHLGGCKREFARQARSCAGSKLPAFRKCMKQLKGQMSACRGD